MSFLDRFLTTHAQDSQPSAEELRQREAQARREYPQTAAAFAKVREAATHKIFQTKPNEAEKREELYRLVHIIGEVERELLMAMGQGQDAIDAYIKDLAEKPATTGNR